MPTIIGDLPIILQNGQAADAAAVMADFNFIVDQVNANGGGLGLLPVFKLTTQAVTLVSVPAIDQALFFNVDAGIYVFKMHIPFASQLVNGFKFQVSGTAPVSSSRYFYNGYWDVGSGGAAQSGLSVNVASWGSGVGFVPSSSTVGWIEINGTAVVTGPGNIGFFWSQNVAGAGSAFVVAGAYLEYVLVQ